MNGVPAWGECLEPACSCEGYTHPTQSELDARKARPAKNHTTPRVWRVRAAWRPLTGGGYGR